MKVLLVILFAVLQPNHPDTEINYREIFGSDYSWAVNWLKEHDRTIKDIAQRFHLPEKELKSIVFPELIRYNKVFDAIQIGSLKYLYVTEGKPYADFSVGFFQMKPSFAEQVENDGVIWLDEDFINRSGIRDWRSTTDSEDGRKARLQRITNIEEQLIYLSAFYKICLQKFAKYRSLPSAERVKFFATCYNAGYARSEASILKFQLKNHYFHYNYASVSVFYFENE